MRTILLLLFIGISLRGAAQEDSSSFYYQRNLPIADIVETITECNCVILKLRYELTEKEIKLVSSGQAILFSRLFNELDSLFDHSNPLIQLYAFGGICTKYPDSLQEKHLTILNSEGVVRIYEQGKDSFPVMPAKEIAAMMYKSVTRNKLDKEQQLIVQKVISDFIVKYAANPKSYVNLKFQNYHVYSIHDGSTLEKIKGSEVFSIKHTFKIKNIRGILSEYQIRFKIDSAFKIILIEEENGEESNTVSCSPPRLDWWFNTVGKKLSKKERKELGLAN